MPSGTKKKIYSNTKFLRMPEADARLEVKKQMFFFASYLFPKWSTAHLLLELMAIRPWLTWYPAGVWEGGGSRGL